MEKILPKYIPITTISGKIMNLPWLCSQEQFDDWMKFELSENDVIIATFPKSGTTWMMNIIYLVTHKGIASKITLEQHFLFGETASATQLSQHQTQPFNFFQTHISWEYLPFNEKCKHICILRNPKDVCTSFYYHTKNFPMYNFEDGSFDDFFKLFVEGKTDFGSYFDHVHHALRHKNDNNVLLLLYENVKMDTKSAVLQIAQFLGKQYFEDVTNPDIMHQILEKCSISSMIRNKKTLTRNGLLENCPVIRRGVIGDWKNLLSEEQANIIDNLSEKHGIKHLWDHITYDDASIEKSN